MVNYNKIKMKLFKDCFSFEYFQSNYFYFEYFI